MLFLHYEIYFAATDTLYAKLKKIRKQTAKKMNFKKL